MAAKTPPMTIEDYKISTMGDAMQLAMERVRSVEDPDPDPYGYLQALEEEFGVDILTAGWKAKPTDNLWMKRVKARARKAAVAKLVLSGYKPHDIAEKVRVSEVTVRSDIDHCYQEWRKSYIGDIELLAGRDLERLETYLTYLTPGIEAGDTKSIVAALEIIKERSTILGYKQGVQVDIEQYLREVAESKGFDPDQAVQFAQRISITMK